MSQSVALCATQITRLEALKRAVEYIQGAKLNINIQSSYVHAMIDLSDNLLIKQSGIPSYGRTIRLTSDHRVKPEVVDGVLTNTVLNVSIDGDYRHQIEAVVGPNGDRLIDYYNREVAYEAIYERYGDTLDYVRFEEVIDGVPVAQLRGVEKEVATGMY